jgi:hypothetical protein
MILVSANIDYIDFSPRKKKWFVSLQNLKKFKSPWAKKFVDMLIFKNVACDDDCN